MRNPDAGAPRSRQKSSKQIGMTQVILAGVAIVVVIVLAVLLFGGGGKKPAKPRSQVASAEEDVLSKPRRSSDRPARNARTARDDEREKRREEREQRRQEARVSGGRTTRTATGGYSRSGSDRVGGSPTQLRAILTDGTGSRFALVGERRFKAGDDLDGRRIVEVTSDAVKVEYRQNTYTVRVGEKIY